jgi:hypothetical protein
MAKIEVKTVKLGEIKLNPDNPRTISKKDMDLLVKSLKDFPDMLNIREIVVDETMTVLGGNMRTLALRKSGAKEATAKIVSGLTPEQKREFVIKDNGAFGSWDMDALANVWGDLPLVDWGVDLPDDWLNPVGEIDSHQLNGDNIELLNSFSIYHPSINKVRSCRFLSVRRFSNDNKNAINTIKNIKASTDLEITKAIASETADLIKSIFGNFIDFNSICTAAPRGHSCDNDYYFAGSLADRIADKLGLISCKLFKDNIKKTKNVHNYNEKKVRLIDDVRGKNIIVFDDIATTGTTIENCCNALREYNFIIPIVWIYENTTPKDQKD